MDPDQLYALPPEEFTAARDAAAKQAKAENDAPRSKELKALRRPSVAAWLVNRLAREQPALLEQLLALGPALAEAQSSGHADQLRTLGRQRRDLVEAVAGAAVSVADRSVAGPVRDEVVTTLEAALADPSSAAAVRTGRLVRALTYAGFGEVDLSGAVAPAAPTPSAGGDGPGRAPRAAEADKAAVRRREALSAAERAAHDAAGKLDDAAHRAAQARRLAVQAVQALEAARRDVSEAERALAGSRRARDAAATASEAKEAAAEKADEAVRTAQDAAERARKELDALRRG